MKVIIKNTVVAVMIAMIMLGAVILFVGCNRESPVQRIERVMGIELPSDAEVLHEYREDSFRDRSARFVLFQLSINPLEFVSFYRFARSEDPSELGVGTRLHWAYNDTRNNNNISNYVVPQEFHPPWEDGFYWIGDFPHYLIFFPVNLWILYIQVPSI
ncbi:MAG: hypothetical protein FWC80_03540 [Firmicutes bacterium]|nr:hypothetical protein [Bacillota bacterium]